MVASTHWLASAAGMAVLERGGNAFDAAVAAGFTLQVVEPHLNGPGGEVPALLYPVERGEPLTLCGQGVAPAAATIERYRELGHDLIPGHGCACRVRSGRVRGRGSCCCRNSARGASGTCSSSRSTTRTTVFRSSAGCGSRSNARPSCSRAGRPRAISTSRYPSSARSSATRRFAATYRRIVEESAGGSRESELERARELFYEGFVADEIHAFSEAEGGLLTREDLAAWRATFEPVVSFDYRGTTVCKTGPWGAGPVALQQLALLEGFDVRRASSEAEFVHVVIECAKLAFADRDALYGDVDVPLDTLLSREYNDARRALVGDEASSAYEPGLGRLPTLVEAEQLAGAGEPTRGDTVHVDVVDRFGNMISATPSGGWLYGSPVIPGPRLAARNARPDVLAGGRTALVASSRRPSADDAFAGSCAPRRRALAGVGNAWRRPAGAMGVPCLPAPPRPRAEPPGGDRRSGVPHRPSDLVVLSTRLRAEVRSRSRRGFRRR